MPAWMKSYPVTGFLVTLNTVLFLAMVIASGPQALVSPSIQTLLAWGANFGPLALTSEPWRIITNAFVHCHLAHLLLNMYALFVVGPDLEQRLGKFQYVLAYFVSAIAGSLLSLELNPTQVSAGASGAIFGLVGCYLAFVPPELAEQAKGTLKRRILFLFVFLAINLAFAQIVGNVDNAAHIGGLIGGLVFGLVASRTTKSGKRFLVYQGSISLLVLFLSAYPLVAAQYDKDPRLSAHKNFLDGVALLQKKNYDQALDCFNKSIDQEEQIEADKEDLVPMLLARSEALRSLKRYQEGFNDANKAAELSPDNASAIAAKAVLLHQLGRYQEAVELCKRLCEKMPGESMVYNNLAWSQLAMGDVAGALTNVNISLSKNGNNSAALDTRGVADLMLKETGQARLDLDRAIEQDHASGGAYFHLAVLCCKQNDQAGCQKNLELAARYNYEPEQWESSIFKNVAEKYKRMQKPLDQPAGR